MRRWSSTDGWHPDRKRLYEFICRSFLASCSKPAVGFQTHVEATIAGETFSTTGEAALGTAACTVPAHIAWRLNSAISPQKISHSFGAQALRPPAGWLLHLSSHVLNMLHLSWRSCCEHRLHALEIELIAGDSKMMPGLMFQGLMVVERNWMEVFPWARWGGNDNLPPFELHQTFMPTELLLKEVCSPLAHSFATISSHASYQPPSLFSLYPKKSPEHAQAL